MMFKIHYHAFVYWAEQMAAESEVAFVALVALQADFKSILLERNDRKYSSSEAVKAAAHI